MHQDISLIKFIERMSNESDQISLSFGDFLPLEEIIGYKTISYKEEVTSVEISDFCRENTKRIIMIIKTNKKNSLNDIEQSIKFIRSQFRQDIEILLGSRMDNDGDELIIDFVLFKNKN